MTIIFVYLLKKNVELTTGLFLIGMFIDAGLIYKLIDTIGDVLLCSQIKI